MNEMDRSRSAALEPSAEHSAPAKLYHKASSFLKMGGLSGEREAVVARLRGVAEALDRFVTDADRRRVIATALSDLLDGVAAGEPEDRSDGKFHLREHVIEEIRRLSDAEIPRYLFYRYRYDIYPLQHVVDDFPPCVQIEPTSVCNFRCVFCYQTDRAFTQGRNGHMGMMTLETFQQVVDQLHGNVEAITLASRGEPLMNKQIDEMLSHAAGKFLGLKINTNASFLTEARAHALLSAEPNTVVFSADAADRELYGKLRVNGDLDKIVRNVELFQQIRSKHYQNSRTITRVSGVKFSDAQDFDVIDQFWKRYVDQVAFVDYNPWESVYLSAPNQVTAPCSDLWRRMFVWWDGLANPCDVDYRSTLQVGSVFDSDVSSLWTGPGYSTLRQAHLDGKRQTISPCKGCVLV